MRVLKAGGKRRLGGKHPPTKDACDREARTVSTDGPVFTWGPDEDDDDGAEETAGKILVAVTGPGPMVPEIVLHGPDPGESVVHRAPRPFTLAQARNQALNYARDMWFDAVVLLSSPPPPWPLAARLWAVAAADSTIAMVTGLESTSAGGARHWVAEQLAAEFGTEAIDIPAPSPECMLLTVNAISQLGIFDANFKVGGEIDWAVRARKAGMRVVTAPAVPVGGPATAAPEGMVLFRHPAFRKDQRTFLESGAVDGVYVRSAAALVKAAAGTIGYNVDVTTQPRPMITHDSLARVSIRPEPSSTIDIRFAGLQSSIEVGEGESADVLLEFTLGRRPEKVVIYDKGPVGEQLAFAWEFFGVEVDDRTAGQPPDEAEAGTQPE
ncbi:MAG: hypothetical protein QOE93_355 [Actinomycetota bacterium]|nr:hypothetical protein [Actinomycetota bacterium]